ncbi:1-acyl-sn-glycerol-3-phosphate acyltransferase [Simkania negevensis]|uniref:1-acyl-sn-glycerol-3-phosphate acyltransferase n=1 Tax=Simkania negevensis TaxID=83561 RepID=A0ABS3ARK6_9BACT|nr:1-acyl-sn-glycerol-3-phosphate acyltransferase [Simkania negevensis]
MSLSQYTGLINDSDLPAEIKTILLRLATDYALAQQNRKEIVQDSLPLFKQLVFLVQKQFKTPYIFAPYHKAIREPINYQLFGVEFFRSFVDMDRSTLSDADNLKQIEVHLQRGDNVVLFSNHQSEADPQILYLLLEKKYLHLAQEMIFVAGHKVTTDILAAPFSMGCNLICIYSKKHIDFPPELKLAKQRHNQKTMKLMGSLLKEGGKCIYVAPSGGRDRRNSKGVIDIAPFDAQSVEMFRLIASQAKTTTHFYPLALATYDILPPPAEVESKLGEERKAQYSPVHLSFGKEIDMNHFPGNEETDRHKKREVLAQHIWSLVNNAYQQFP